MIKEKKWLVKSSDSILGPYEFDTVVENIFNGEVHLLDEIKGPLERWRPIKDHSLFAAAIEKLKATTYQQREETMTGTLDLGTKTQELTRTQTVSVGQADSDSESGGDDSLGRPQPSLPEYPGDRTQRGGFLPQERGLPLSRKKSRFSSTFFISFLVLVIGGASYLVLEFKQKRMIEQKISAYDQLTDVALDALKVGEYQKALQNFTTASNISPTDPNLLLEMSPLSIQFDGQFDQAQVSLEKLVATTRHKSVKKMAQNIIGLSFAYRQRYAEALVSYDSALQSDDQFLPARLNKAQVLMKLKKYDEAVALMRQVVSEHPDEAVAHYFYVRSLSEQGLNQNNEKVLKEALSVTDQYAQKFSDFRQEVLFLVAVINAQLGGPAENITVMVNNFLRVDFELTRLHVHDTLIDFQSFNWVDYYPLCKKLNSKLTEYSQKMLDGFCLLKVGRTLDAKKIFENLLSQKNDDGVLQALYASTLLKLNDVSQAKNALGFVDQVDQKQPMVETILRGCLIASDLNCAQAIFRGKHAKRISLLYSHWGNSELMYEKDRGSSQRSVHLGLGISPNFAPLLKLRRNF